MERKINEEILDETARAAYAEAKSHDAATPNEQIHSAIKKLLEEAINNSLKEFSKSWKTTMSTPKESEANKEANNQNNPNST